MSDYSLTSPTSSGHDQICASVATMPSTIKTDDLLPLLGTRRSQVASDRITMQTNMEQDDAEGYGWQNAIDGSGALEPRLGAWLIGARHISCGCEGNF